MLVNDDLYLRRANIGRSISVLCAKRSNLTPQDIDLLGRYESELRQIESQVGNVLQERHDKAFRTWLRRGHSGLTPDLRAALVEVDYRATLGLEGGGAAYPGSTTGVLVPMGYRDAIASATKFSGPLMQLADVDWTDHGNLKAYPGDNDTAVSATFLNESAQVASVDLTQNQVILGAYKVQSGIIVMSREEVQDVVVRPSLHDFLAARFGVRFGRLINQYATTGTGVNQPTGFLTSVGTAAGTAVGASGNDGSSGANTLGTVDFQVLESKLDYSYRQNAVYMCHPTTLAQLKNQLDKYGHLLYPGLQTTEQTIGGYPVKANPFLPALPTTANSPTVTYKGTLCFGDFSKLVIRLTTPAVHRLEERYIENFQVGFFAHTRFDCNIVDGGGGAIQFLNTTY
jgi:HK97 family phage major capsid protein